MTNCCMYKALLVQLRKLATWHTVQSLLVYSWWY